MTLKIALRHLLRKPFLTAFTLIAITGALTILGSFWLVVENLERVRVNLVQTENGETIPGLTVFVDPKATSDEVQSVRTKFLSDKRFQTVEIVNSQDALKNLETQFGEALSKVFTQDTMPITLKLTYSVNSFSQAELMGLLNEVRSLPIVLDVDDGLSVFPGPASQKTSPVFSWATALLVFVFMIVALLVSHLIRIAFETLKPELETLKVLGASKFWIFKPLFVEGTLFGFIGSLGALALLWSGVEFLVPRFSDVLLPKNFEVLGLSWSSSLGLVSVSLFASIVGALFTWPLIERPATEV
jgi:cell division transport system permease protein